MNRQLIIIGGLILIIFSFGLFMFFSATSQPDPTDTFVDLDQVSDDAPIRNPDDLTSGEKITVVTDDGVVVINDITTLPTTHYRGPTLFDLSNNTEDLPFQPFSVVFSSDNGSLAVSLNEAPFGATRIAAENLIMSQLGIGQSDMCKLNVFVGIPVGVDIALSGPNYGFSFCPGSVALE